MKRKRHTPEQIVRKLREADRLRAEGQTVEQIVQKLAVSEQTYHRWRNQYGAMGEDQAKELKSLKEENARLKKLLADAHLDMDIMRVAMREK